MAVHYPKQMMREVREQGLRLVTIDCGAGIRYQGGCTPQEHHDLIHLVEHLCEQTARRTFVAPAEPAAATPSPADHVEDLLDQVEQLTDELAEARQAEPAPSREPAPKAKKKRGRKAKSR